VLTVPRPTAKPDQHVGFALPPVVDAAAIIAAMTRSVLVVDDDPSFLALAARVLHEMGVEAVLMAHDAAEAVSEAEAKRPDAMLVDVGLPDRDGIELARQLAELPWAPRVVVTSSDPGARAVIRARQMQTMLPFIPKEDLADATLRGLLTAT
jgi:CheY-like chemotaxis protein